MRFQPKNFIDVAIQFDPIRTNSESIQTRHKKSHKRSRRVLENPKALVNPSWNLHPLRVPPKNLSTTPEGPTKDPPKDPKRILHPKKMVQNEPPFTIHSLRIPQTNPYPSIPPKIPQQLQKDTRRIPQRIPKNLESNEHQPLSRQWTSIPHLLL